MFFLDIIIMVFCGRNKNFQTTFKQLLNSLFSETSATSWLTWNNWNTAWHSPMSTIKKNIQKLRQSVFLFITIVLTLSVAIS